MRMVAVRPLVGLVVQIHGSSSSSSSGRRKCRKVAANNSVSFLFFNNPHNVYTFGARVVLCTAIYHSLFCKNREKLRPIVAPADHAHDDGGSRHLLARAARALPDGHPVPHHHLLRGQVSPAPVLLHASAGLINRCRCFLVFGCTTLGSRF